MSDFLHRLAARAMGDVPVVQPIVPTLFAPDVGLERLRARPRTPRPGLSPPAGSRPPVARRGRRARPAGVAR